MKDGQERKGSFKTIVSVLIALVAVTGAFIAWQSSQSSGEASALESNGIKAALARAKAEIEISANLYRNQINFDSYLLDYRSAEITLDQTTEVPTTMVGSQQALDQLFYGQMEFVNRAAVYRDLVDTDYLHEQLSGSVTDSFFDQDRYRQAMLAQAAAMEAIDPQVYFPRVDFQRGRTLDFALSGVILSGSLVCFTLAFVLSNRWKFFPTAMGCGMYIFSLVIAFTGFF
jgi:transcriptional regulator NrdR family protein